MLDLFLWVVSGCSDTNWWLGRDGIKKTPGPLGKGGYLWESLRAQSWPCYHWWYKHTAGSGCYAVNHVYSTGEVRSTGAGPNPVMGARWHCLLLASLGQGEAGSGQNLAEGGRIGHRRGGDSGSLCRWILPSLLGWVAWHRLPWLCAYSMSQGVPLSLQQHFPG